MPSRRRVARATSTMGTMKLFILHGWTYDALTTWRPLLTMLTTRNVDFEFLKIPGLTDGTDPVWTVDDYVEWLRVQTAVYDNVMLYGHSNGGRISLAFAAKYPDKVARLILEDSAGIPPSGVRRMKRDFFRLLAKIGGKFIRSEGARALVYKIIRENDYQQASPNMRTTMTNLVSVDLTSYLPKILTPTLIIWGKRDKTTPFKNGLFMNRKIRNSRLLVIPDARHSPHITHPQKVADAVVDFIA